MGKLEPVISSSQFRLQLLSANYCFWSHLAFTTLLISVAAISTGNCYSARLSDSLTRTAVSQNDEGNAVIDNDIFSSGRSKRLPQHIINDCMLVTSKPGHYYFKTTRENYDKEGSVCGIYLMVDPDEIIQINFDHMDMPCAENAIVSFVDGWELNGSYFPSEEDYNQPISQRFKEYCGRKRVKQILESSQNAALIKYRVPKPGRGFSFYFSTKKNPMPCHVLVESPSYVYTLRNYGKRVNCTLMSMSPAKIKVLSLTVGVMDSKNNHVETGTYHKCDQKGMTDYVQIGSGIVLGDISMATDTICGVDSVAGDTSDSVFCDATIVRLVSSGETNNQITIAMQKMDQEDASSIKCPYSNTFEQSALEER